MMTPEIISHPLKGHAAVRPRPVAGAVVHSMGEFVTYQGQRLYAPDCLTAQKVSVHAMVLPDGKIMQCVDPRHGADHAGESRFGELESLNGKFLGAEFLVQGTYDYGRWLTRIAQPDAYTAVQYEAGGWLYASWMRDFGFPRTSIVAHSAVSGDDVRGKGNGKRDPGAGFNWKVFLSWVDEWSAELRKAA